MKQGRHSRLWTKRAGAGFLAFAMSLSLLPPRLSFGTELDMVDDIEAIIPVESNVVDVTTQEEQDIFVLTSEGVVQVETLAEGDDQSLSTDVEGATTFDVVADLEVLTPETPDHWAEPYTEKMVEYGYLRAADAADPDKDMTRAEFMAVINRAYNYTELGKTMPYIDVTRQDWFYDDISIATNSGYISGTSPNTVEPYGTLTRETTAFILGKNLMLPTVFGEDLNFTDTREVSDWSRALVRATSEYGLMAGYTDGSFRPLSNITTGEISALVMKAIGTPILQSGETSLGEVFGNVTITESGTILKNTVIAGDLHISNGIGLGSVMLENVTVLGRIVVSGGESEGGDASILLRNVVAEELVIDNMDDQYVSVRVDGDTYIENTYVRTNAYVEDTTTTDMGLREVYMDADPGIVLELAGRIKTVTNTSPGTTIRVVDGTVDQMNIDERATEVVTEILRGAEVIEMNVDVSTDVVGDGDIKNLTVNAEDVVVEMLPDNIEIRPGITADIFGEEMDNLTAEEFSTQPMILSGYPVASDIAPTSIDALFMTNKVGTIYWAVSNISQGSVTVEDLINPPSYGHIATSYGSIDITEANTEFMAPVNDLPIGGNYYLSAVLVDAREDRSPLKVVAFTTPDDTVPAFGEGYPYISAVDNISAQTTVMATKDCVVYFAVLPLGALEPTGEDFLSGSISGALGSGSHALTKNKSMSFTVSDILDEMTEYNLYLWLTDADGMNYSEVVCLNFITIDKTPPVFNQEVQTTNIGVTDVSFAFNVNEAGTLYWAVVESGIYYPSVKPGDTTGNLSEPLTTDYAAYSVMWGIGALYSGNMNVNANTTHDFTLSNLALETAYDMYYVARDESGNFSNPVKMLTFNTVDNTPPTFVEQNFSHTANAGDDSDLLPQPYASTSITLVFSEGIQATNSGQSFLQLYSNVLAADGNDEIQAAKKTLGDTLAYCFPFYTWSGNSPTDAVVRTYDNENNADLEWLIDYRNVTVTMLNGQMNITFPTVTDDSNKTGALNLSAGVTYGFKIQNIRDSSSDANIMVPAELTAGQNSLGLEKFTTVYAQIMLGTADVMVGNLPYARDGAGNPISNSYAIVDADLQVTPNDMGNVDERVVFEMRMNPDQFVSYNMYMRIVNPSGKYDPSLYDLYFPDAPSVSYMTDGDNIIYEYLDANGDPVLDANGYVTGVSRKEKVANNWEPDDNGWVYLNIADVMSKEQSGDFVVNGDSSGMGVGLISQYWGYLEDTMAYPYLFELGDEYQFEFVFEVTQFGSSTTRGEWNGFLDMGIQIWAGNYNTIKSIGLHSSPSAATYNTLSLVSTPENYNTEIVFTDSIPPTFGAGAPQVTTQDITASLDVSLSRNGELFYVLVPSNAPNNFGPEDDNGIEIAASKIPDINADYFISASLWPLVEWPTLSSPFVSELIDQVNDPGTGVVAGSVTTGMNTVTIEFEDLDPLQEYYVYFFMKSTSGGGYSDVYLGKFTTQETEKPRYTNMNASPSTADVSWLTHVDAELDYLMLTTATVAEVMNWVNQPFYYWLLNNATESSKVPVENSDTDYYTFVELYHRSPYWKNVDEKYFFSIESVEDFEEAVAGYNADSALYEKYLTAYDKWLGEGGDENPEPAEVEKPDYPFENAYTVLDLLTTLYQETGGNYDHPDYVSDYTAFDVFASDTMKAKLYEDIIGVNQSIISKSAANATIGNYTTAIRNPDTGSDPDFVYVFFVTGKNVNAPSNDPVANTHTFRSLTNFAVTDVKGPVIDSVASQITPKGNDTITKPTTYSGFISLSFDKYLYASLGTSTRFLKMTADQVDPSSSAWNGQTLTLTDYWKVSRTAAGIVPYKTANPDVPTKVLMFDYEDVVDGDTIMIFTGSSFLVNKNGVQHDSPSGLILTFRTEDVPVSTSTTNAATGVTTVTTVTTTYAWWETNWESDYTTTSGINHQTAIKTTTTIVTESGGINALTLDPSEWTMARNGQKTLIAYTDGGVAVGGNIVSWSSSNPSELTVANGLVTALAENGTYTVTATYLSKTATCIVTVGDGESDDIVPEPEPEELFITPTSQNLTLGQTVTFTVTTDDDDIIPTSSDIDWTVTYSGGTLGTNTTHFYRSGGTGNQFTYKAYMPDTYTVTATWTEYGISATATVTVASPTLTLTAESGTDSITVDVFDKLTATIAGYDDLPGTYSLEWSATGSGVNFKADGDGNGLAPTTFTSNNATAYYTGATEGTGTITLTVKNSTYTIISQTVNYTITAISGS